jgi:hypothetical protein
MIEPRRLSIAFILGASLLAAAGCDTNIDGDGDDDGAGGSSSSTGSSGPQTAVATSVAGGCDPEETVSTGMTVGVTTGGGGDGGGDSVTVTVGAGVTTGGGSGERSAVSMLAAQLPPGTISCEDGAACPGDMLVLFVDSNGNTCASPQGFPSNDPQQSRYVIGVPAELQNTGVIDLSSMDVVVFSEVSETQPNSGATATVGVGPGGTGGTLVIHEIDEDSISFTLSGLAWGDDPNGSYTAERCGS